MPGSEWFWIVGGAGQVGHRVLERFSADKQRPIFATSRLVHNGFPESVLASTVESKIRTLQKQALDSRWFSLDLELPTNQLIKQLDPFYEHLGKSKLLNQSCTLVFSGAFTNVDGCELDPAKCRLINIENTSAVLEWAKEKFQTRPIFLSTDYVFDGTQGPYAETESPNPLSEYGRAKLAIEDYLTQNFTNYLIIRTTGVFDFIPGSKNFLMQALALLQAGKKMKVPSDQISSPTWAKDLAEGIFLLCEKNAKGVFNIAGDEILARDEFARKIAQIFQLNSTLIESITTESLQQKAKRPLKSGLKLQKLFSIVDWKPLAATQALELLQKGEPK